MYQQTLSFGWLSLAWEALLEGAWLTIWLTLQALVLGSLIAIVGAWAKTSGPRFLGIVFSAYVEIIRNTPFLLQLFFFFFGLPSVGIFLTPTQTALLAMVVNLGAYATEIIRAGVEAIPHGQVIYPPLAGQFTMVLLGSSLASAISAHELTSAANIIATANFRTLEVYFVVTLIYLVIVFFFRGLFALFYNFVLARSPDQRMKLL